MRIETSWFILSRLAVAIRCRRSPKYLYATFLTAIQDIHEFVVWHPRLKRQPTQTIRCIVKVSSSSHPLQMVDTFKRFRLELRQVNLERNKADSSLQAA